MKKGIFGLCISLLFQQVHAGEEFLYPVDTIVHEGIEKLCILHQKGNHLELWFWDPTDQSTVKGLLSSFTPAGLAVLPEKNAFSFIDNDRVRIKFVDKRSPKSLDLYGPYDLTTLHWIDTETFYFSAKERQHGNLFHATLGGDLFRLTLSDHNDYTYPQKIGETLFCVERSDRYGYAIIKTDYPTKELHQQLRTVLNVSDFESRFRLALEQEGESGYKAYLDLKNAERLFCTTETSIAFLSMKDQNHGFFVEHPEVVDLGDETMKFRYMMLFFQEGAWQTTQLFEFTLPLHFILPKRGTTRLYESILPLLPSYDAHSKPQIYFLDYDHTLDGLNVFSYDLESGVITQKTTTQFFGQSYFTPRSIGNSLFCGGTVTHNFRNDKGPHINIDPSGTQYFTFLELQ